MTIDNELKVEFAEGYYRELIENTYKKYLEENEKKPEHLLEEIFGEKEAIQENAVFVAMPDENNHYFKVEEDMEEDIRETWVSVMGDLYVCSMEGMTEMFECRVENETASIKSCGFEPYLSAWSPYHGGIYSVVLALAQIVASGGDYKKVKFSFQTIFENMENHPEHLGKPFAAFLGAYEAQKGFDLSLREDEEAFSSSKPECIIEPTIMAFGETETVSANVVTPEFKKEDNKIVRFCIPYDKFGRPVYEEAIKIYKQIHKMMKKGYIQAACPVSYGGTLEALAKMCFTNELGVRLDEDLRPEQLVQKAYGAIVAEIKPRDIRHIEIPCMFLGEVIEEPVMEYLEEVIPVEELEEAWENTRK